jgi:chemosensory pili system protein ChpA (sensor histidine kinase/response regulator)
MSTLGKVDSGTLGWVKTEIDETLKQARLALETYAENTADDSALRHCTTYLHQVLGTLQMVELDGAAMLARETEALAEAVLGDAVPADPATTETLIRGILTLPEYLARLQFGQPDAPLKFLPLLNELRERRGVEPLNEFDLFQPDLDVRPPKHEGAVKADEADYALAVKQLRPPFQATLLNWLRDTGNRRYLDELAAMIDGLQVKAPLPLLEQHFWVASGYLDALACGAVPLTNDRKKLLARLEQQLKKIAIRSERSVLRSSAEWLTKAMLFEIGQAHAAVGKTAEIKRAFALDQLLPGSEGEYGMPTPEALQSVAEALGQEIGQAQDLVSTYFENGDPATLEPLITQLHRMSGTLEMMGVEVLKAVVDELAGLSQQLQRGELQRSDALAMPMATALLLLENSTRNVQALGADWKHQVEETIAGLRQLRAGSGEELSGIEISDASLSDSEFRQLVAVVGGEIRINLGKIEEVLETFAADPSHTEALDPVPPSLSQIQGALQILGQERASELAVTTSQLVQDLREGRLSADSAILDALAVAVGTIGAYVEGLERDRPNLETMLTNARHDLSVALTGKRPHSGEPDLLLSGIEQSLTAWLADHQDRDALSALRQDLRDVAWLAGSQRQERTGKIAEQMISLLDMIEGGEVSDEAVETLRQSHEAFIQIARGSLKPQPLARSAPRVSSKAKAESVAPVAVATPAAPAAPARPVAKPAPALDLDEDDDIMLIFIEDAREMIALINKTLPDWHADSSNRDVLLDLRRAFHTLKGSGRMVGASDISEFAWAIENMLNRVREGKIAPTPTMFDLLFRARDLLPEMVAQLEGGPAPGADLLALRAVADALAEGREAEMPAERAPPPSAPVAEEVLAAPAAPEPLAEAPLAAPVADSHAVPTADDLPTLDSTLLQIFTNETRGHVSNVRSEIERCRSHGLGSQVPESLVRAVHTLQGTARAVGLRAMAEASAEIERLMHILQDHQQPLNEDAYALFGRLTHSVEALIDQLNRGEHRAPEAVHDLLATAQAAREFQQGAGHPSAVAARPRVPEPATATPAPAAVEIGPAVTAAVPAARSRPVEPLAVTPQPAVAPVRSSPPAAPAAVAADNVDERLDPELLEIFLEEAVDILASIEESLTRWRGNRTNKLAVAELKRQLHTLKGGARMSGAMTMGNLGHQTESLLGEIELGRVNADNDLMDLMDEVHDALVVMLDQMRDGKPVRAFTAVTNKVLVLLGQKPLPAAAAPARPVAPAPTPAVVPEPWIVEIDTPAPVAASMPEPVEPAAAEADPFAPHIDRRHVEGEEVLEAIPGADRREQIRVRTSLLNELVNFAGEVSIARSRMEQQIFGLRENLAELNTNTTRFRDQIRELEIQSESQILARSEAMASRAGEDFDPLEFDRFSRLQTLSRSLAESLHDLFTIRGNLENYASQAESVLQQQARINTDLQEGLMRTRMIGVATQGARLRHIVRQTAREVGKRVEFEIVGGEVEVDRTVLERMIGPFEHMIRNAIDHGLESEDERRKAGKPATGRISFAASHEGSEVVIRFADDGKGLDTAAIRRKAIERGMMKANANLSDDELVQFILMPGFSTAAKVTQLSGRGVGMDVVHSEVKQLGGSITVDTRRGQGTTFIIRLPLTLSIAQALMVRAGEQLFAVPLSSVINILEVPVESLQSIQVGTKPLLNWQDQVYPFMNLAVRLGIHPQPGNPRKVPVLLARSGGRQVAIQVDGLAGTREIVIKPLGAQLAGIEGLAGATILGDGSVVLILDVPGLWLLEEGLQVTHSGEREPLAMPQAEEIGLASSPVYEPVAGEPVAPLAPVEPATPVEAARTRALVMVVDDSITVRKVTQRHLVKRGMDVLLAKDGVDAMEQLREILPDVMLVDIEMPRMDGYELTQHVRGDARLKDIPIIMITSRAGDKHRDKALALGVNIYMTKPYQEDTLLSNIDTLLPPHLAGS